MTVLALTIHIHILEKHEWIRWKLVGVVFMYLDRNDICVRRFDIIFAGLSCWISIRTYWNINIHIQISTKQKRQSKVLQQKNTTKRTTYLLLPPQKRSSPSFFHLNFSVPKKRLSPHSSVGLPEPTSLPSQLAQNGGENPRAFDSTGVVPRFKRIWQKNGKRIWDSKHLKILLIQKKLKRRCFSWIFFHPSVCGVSRLLGKKRQFKPWMRLDTTSFFWNVS